MPGDWLLIAGFWALILGLFAAEVARPLRRDQAGSGGRLVTNFALGGINLLLMSLLPLSAVLAATWSEASGVGLLHRIGAGPLLAVFATVLARSLASYGLHRLAHNWTPLWRVHKVHHCDTAVDLTTGLRHHPFELLYVAGAIAAMSALFGLSAPALIAYELVAAAFALWTHANLAIPAALDRRLRLLFATPAAHGVHHSATQPETDCNYGEVFTCWDRLFGSYSDMTPSAVERLRPGLGDSEDGVAGKLHIQLCSPLLPAIQPPVSKA